MTKFEFSMQVALDKALDARKAAEEDVAEARRAQVRAEALAALRAAAAEAHRAAIAAEVAQRRMSRRPADRLALDAWAASQRQKQLEVESAARGAALDSRFAAVQLMLREAELASAVARTAGLERMKQMAWRAHLARQQRREDEYADELAQQRSSRDAACNP